MPAGRGSKGEEVVCGMPISRGRKKGEEVDWIHCQTSPHLLTLNGAIYFMKVHYSTCNIC